jgi:hypothetical protein
MFFHEVNHVQQAMASGTFDHFYSALGISVASSFFFTTMLREMFALLRTLLYDSLHMGGMASPGLSSIATE